MPFYFSGVTLEPDEFKIDYIDFISSNNDNNNNGAAAPAPQYCNEWVNGLWYGVCN